MTEHIPKAVLIIALVGYLAANHISHQAQLATLNDAHAKLQKRVDSLAQHNAPAPQSQSPIPSPETDLAQAAAHQAATDAAQKASAQFLPALSNLAARADSIAAAEQSFRTELARLQEQLDAQRARAETHDDDYRKTIARMNAVLDKNSVDLLELRQSIAADPGRRDPAQDPAAWFFDGALSQIRIAAESASRNLQASNAAPSTAAATPPTPASAPQPTTPK